MYQQAIENLETRPVMPEKPPSLEVMHQALPLIGFFESPFWETLKKKPKQCILVAGTNGKGSVCATLEALLLNAGCRVGMYTSPHLVEATERIRLQGQDISREHFSQSFEAVEHLTREWQKRNGGYTHFEMMTLMAVWFLCSGKLVPAVDWLILEVGLGGLWDATNAVPHGTAVVTTLGIDHQNLLGHTLPQIAKNKFGIIRKQPQLLDGNAMLVVHTPFPKEVRPVAQEVAQQVPSQWIESQPVTAETVTRGNTAQYFVGTQWGKAPVVLAGERGAQNTATALATFAALGFDPTGHLEALKEVRWPGRMQEVPVKGARCPVYFSGDHNAQGIQSLLQILNGLTFEHVHFVVGIVKDKSFDEMLTTLTSVRGAKLYLTETHFKALRLAEYGPWLERACKATPKPEEALAAAVSSAGINDVVVVTGSLYLVGYLLGSLKQA